MKKKKKNAVFEDIITTVSRCFIVLVVIVVVCIGLSGIKFVKPGEVAVILRFGKVVGNTQDEQIHESGILFAFPYIVDEVVTVPTGTVMEKVVETHYMNKEEELVNINNNQYVVTGDNKLAVMKVSVKYMVTNPVDYALKVKDFDQILNACASNAMIQKAASMDYLAILTSEKETFAKSVENQIQENIDACKLGVTLVGFDFLDVGVPTERLNTAYSNADSAISKANSAKESARGDADRAILDAETTAGTLISNATAVKEQKKAAAVNDLSEFWGLKGEYEKSYASQAAVRLRVKNDKLTKALSSIGKIVVVKDGDSHIIIN